MDEPFDYQSIPPTIFAQYAISQANNICPTIYKPTDYVTRVH